MAPLFGPACITVFVYADVNLENDNLTRSVVMRYIRLQVRSVKPTWTTLSVVSTSGALQAPPPVAGTPLHDRDSTIGLSQTRRPPSSGPAYTSTHQVRHGRYLARDDAMTSLAATVSTCPHTAIICNYITSPENRKYNVGPNPIATPLWTEPCAAIGSGTKFLVKYTHTHVHSSRPAR